MKLSNTRLWWPKLNEGVAFTWLEKNEAGDGGRNRVDSYRFFFDPEMSEFIDISNGLHMPISEAKLIDCSTQEKINFTSLAILEDGRVQVNIRVSGGYVIRYYSLENLEFTGYTYDPKEDMF